MINSEAGMKVIAFVVRVRWRSRASASSLVQAAVAARAAAVRHPVDDSRSCQSRRVCRLCFTLVFSFGLFPINVFGNCCFLDSINSLTRMDAAGKVNRAALDFCPI